MEMNNTNKEIEDINVLNELANEYSQPILYLKQVPNADTIVDIIEKNNNILLHNAPISASNNINSMIIKKIFENKDKGLLDAIFTGNYLLDYNQISIAVKEFCNYIIHNTIISFCTMLDFTGEMYRSIIDYLPLKTHVSESLNDREIYCFIYDYMHDHGKNSFGYLFNEQRSFDNNFKVDADRIHTYTDLLATQIDQIIYTKICTACSEVLNEVLLGTRVSPNKSYVVDKACSYFNIKNNGIETVYEVFYRLNTDLVNKIDKFMNIVVCPMTHSVFQDNIFTNLYFLFQIINKENDISSVKIIDQHLHE